MSVAPNGGPSPEHSFSLERAGPLDIVRQRSLEAEELDRLARMELAHDDPEIFSELKDQVGNLESGHPLLKQNVIIYGTPLTADIQRVLERGRPLSGPDLSSQVGKYGGMMITETTDAFTGKETYRVVHTVHTGSSDMVPDGFGNLQQTHFMNYILATGSEIVPIDPVNAHSLVDLRHDGLVAAVDRLVLDESDDRSQVITTLGAITNRSLMKNEWDSTDIGNQRISYINAMGLLAGTSITTKELVHGDKHNYLNGSEVHFSDRSFVYSVKPEIFEIVPGYMRLSGGNVPIMGGAPELFVRGRLDDGQPVMVPVKDIQSVYALC